MKLRLYRDSLRLRLNQDEVRQLIATQLVTDSTPMSANAEFIYGVRASRSAPSIQAVFQGNQIIVDVPLASAAEWVGGKSVSLEAIQPMGNKRSLKILIEKDFECLDPSMSEPNERLYPNPNKPR